MAHRRNKLALSRLLRPCIERMERMLHSERFASVVGTLISTAVIFAANDTDIIVAAVARIPIKTNCKDFSMTSTASQRAGEFWYRAANWHDLDDEEQTVLKSSGMTTALFQRMIRSYTRRGDLSASSYGVPSEGDAWVCLYTAHCFRCIYRYP